MAVHEGKALASGFYHLMLSQVSTRLLTFILNWLVVKRLSPEDYGLSAQFHLLTVSILFLGREGFRRGCLRSQESNQPLSAAMMNVAWLTVPAGTLLSLFICTAVIQSQRLQLTDPYSKSIIIFGLSTVIELLSEPLYILAQSLLLVKTRVVIEGVATLFRCLSTYILLTNNIGLRGGVLFAIAELSYSFTLFAGYWGYFLLKLRQTEKQGSGNRQETSQLSMSDLFPKRVRGSYFPEWDPLKMSLVFSAQSVVKHCMAKGDEFVLTLFDSRYNQGVYNLVTNLGSLVVRSVLNPFEESLFLVFAKISSKSTGQESNKVNSVRLGHTFSLCVKLTIILGLFFACFGPNFSHTLISILYGSKWANGEAPAVLSYYCVLILALALNGITESFVHSVASPKQLRESNYFLLLSSTLHVALNVVFVRLWGASGLVLANLLNMAMRISFSLLFAKAYFKTDLDFKLVHILPRRAVLAAFALSFVVSRFSEATNVAKGGAVQWKQTLVHVAIGGALFLGTCLAIGVFETRFIREVRNLVGSGDTKEIHGNKEE